MSKLKNKMTKIIDFLKVKDTISQLKNSEIKTIYFKR